MEQGHYALLLDDESESAAQAALRLIRLGVLVLYAKWPDEARLLASQEAGRVRALVASSRVAPETIAELRKRVSRTTADRPPSLLLVGPRPDEAAREQLRKIGVSGVLWEPYDDAELRFVINACLALPYAVAPRQEPRAPANSLCWIRVAATRAFGVLYTISGRGAYVEMARPLPVGAEVNLEFEFAEVAVETGAKVIHQVTPAQARESSLPCGVACVFTGLPQALQERIRAVVRERAGRYSL